MHPNLKYLDRKRYSVCFKMVLIQHYPRSAIYFMQIRRLSYGQLKSWYCGLVTRPPPSPPYSHVVQIGDPILRAVSEVVPVDLVKSPEMKLLIDTMKEVCKRYNCVGLSAPQIGIGLRVLLAEFSATHAKEFSKETLKNKEMAIFPQTVIINPEVRITDYTKIIHSELCASIKGFSADVPRYRAIEVFGLNEDGVSIKLNVKGWISRIFQHEIDHLNGKLYTDVMDKKTLTCCCWQAVNERRGKVEIPFSR